MDSMDVKGGGTGPERDTQEKVWTALEKATKSSQPLCANSQGKKKVAPPASAAPMRFTFALRMHQEALRCTKNDYND